MGQIRSRPGYDLPLEIPMATASGLDRRAGGVHRLQLAMKEVVARKWARKDCLARNGMRKEAKATNLQRAAGRIWRETEHKNRQIPSRTDPGTPEIENVDEVERKDRVCRCERVEFGSRCRHHRHRHRRKPLPSYTTHVLFIRSSTYVCG